MATARLGQSRSTLGTMRLGHDDSGGGTIFSENVNDTLSLSDFAYQNDHLFIFDTLVLTDRVVRGVSGSASSVLSLSDSASVAHAYGRSVVDTLSLVDLATESGGNIESAADMLFLSDMVSVDVSPINVSVNDTLNLTDSVQHIFDTIHTSSILSLSDSVVQGLDPIHDKLTLVDTVSVAHLIFPTDGNPFGGIHQSLILAHTVSVNFSASVSASDTLELSQSVAPVIVTAQDCQYAPQIGATADLDVILPPVTQPTLTSGTLTLTWSSLTVVLRNPEYDNKFQYQQTRVNRTTRGGTLVVFADPIWPKLKKLEFTVTYLQGIQMQELQNFLLASIGQTIGLVDWEGQHWQGIILNPEAEISNPQRGNWSVGLQFQGELV